MKEQRFVGVKDKFLLRKKRKKKKKEILSDNHSFVLKYSIMSQKYLWVSNHFLYYPGKHVQVAYGYMVLYFFINYLNLFSFTKSSVLMHDKTCLNFEFSLQC